MLISVRANTALFLAFCLTGLHAQTALPRVFLLDPATLAQQKAHPDPAIVKAARSEADKFLSIEPLTVTTKGKTPPSGDKHDYMSLARYWWPNPDTPNHLPYVRHDGKTNPEINEIGDLGNVEKMSNATRSLALAWYITGDQRYANRAAILLRAWFIEPATKMNPNLNFAQYVPGVNTGRGAGILDGRRLTLAVDAVGLLAGSKTWTAADQAGMQKWFSAYFDWLTNSKPAHDEDKAPNNHGSWFQAQRASVAMFIGKPEVVKAMAIRVRDERIPSQFDSAGMQKYELVRTNSFSYSAFNLEALTQFAAVATPTGIDIYKPAKAGAPGLLTGLDALLPYDAKNPWPHEQISSGKEDSICPALVRAAAHTHEAKYAEAERRFDCPQSAVFMLEALSSVR